MTFGSYMRSKVYIVWWQRRTFPTAEITAARRRSDGAPTADRPTVGRKYKRSNGILLAARRCSNGSPAAGHCSNNTPSADRRRPDVALMALRRRTAGGPTSLRYCSDSSPLSVSRHFTLGIPCTYAYSTCMLQRALAGLDSYK